MNEAGAVVLRSKASNRRERGIVIVKLLGIATDELRLKNTVHDKKTDIIARILRCEQILPVLRANVNGQQHKL